MYQFLDLKKLIECSTEKYNKKILYEFSNITYNKFLKEINYLGTSLLNMGLKGKRIAILSENRYEWEISFFAIACGVGIVVPLDRSLPKGEIARILKRSRVDLVFSSKEYEKLLEEIKMENNCCLYKIVSFDSLQYKNLLLKGKKLTEKGDKTYISTKINSNKICAIFYTSGTSDKSKAVMLSHKNVCTNVQNVAKVFELNSNDKVLSILPLSHVLEGIFCMLLSIYNGATRIHCNKVEDIMEYILKYEITFMCGVPFLFEILSKDLSMIKTQIPKINMFMSAGASLNEKIIKRYEKAGIKLVQGYGMTESGPVITIENKENCKIGSVGKKIPNIHLKLLKKDKDGIGEIAVKGENIFIGFFENEIATKEMLKNGWLLTGDLGRIDSDNYLYIVGRLKNVIVLTNGKKVYPEEIEYLINQIDGVKENLVYCISYGPSGYMICTDIVYDKNHFKNIKEKEIKQIINRKIEYINEILPGFKRIRRVKISNKELEKTSTGKIKRIQYFEKK